MLRVCDRFGCAPREAYRQDATVIGLMGIENLLGWRREVNEEWPEA